MEVEVISTNPGIKIKVDDETILKLFMDVAALKAQMKIVIAVMVGGFGALSGLVIFL